jgi:hypothetical protein
VGRKAIEMSPDEIFTHYADGPASLEAESWNYAGRALKPSPVLFRASRGHIVQLVRQIAGAWECWLVIQWPHRELGRVTVGQVIEMQARHVDAHIDDIHKIRQAHSC